MRVLSVQAENIASTQECVRLDAALPRESRNGASFSSRTHSSRPDARPAPAVSIAVWGDSLTSARDFMQAAMNSAGMPKESAVPSFIQAGMAVPGLQLPLKAGCASKGWQVAYALKEKRSQAGFSKGLLSMRSRTLGDTIALDFRFPSLSTRVKQLALLYEKPTPDGSLLLGVSIDGGVENFVSLSRSSGSVLQIQPDVPMTTLRIRLVSGEITVHGFAPTYQDAPAAIVDSFSVPSGLLRSWSSTGERFFSAAPEVALQYSLIVVQYGTNEGASPIFSRQNYVSYVDANLRRLRQFYPRSRCVLIGPPDRGVVGNAGPLDPLKYANVHRQIAQVQKQVGLEHRCEFWDWQAAMGGPGSALRWATMKPPQMQPDLTHLTAKGYQVSGHMFAQAFPLNKN